MQAALKGAVSMCKRHSRDTAPSTAQELWFTVLQRYVALLRQLRLLARQRSNGSSAAQQTQRLESAQVRCLTECCLVSAVRWPSFFSVHTRQRAQRSHGMLSGIQW